MRRMTDDDIRDIVRLYKEHATFSAVAKVLSISKTTVSKYVRLDANKSIFKRLSNWWRKL